jgi:hypothetical protein
MSNMEKSLKKWLKLYVVDNGFVNIHNVHGAVNLLPVR